MTQAEAFLAQARSDLRVYDELRKIEVDRCHPIHYLQIATEKLAKAKMDAEGVPIARVHSGFCKYLRILANRNDIALIRDLSCSTFPQFQAKIKGLMPVASVIENCAPALAVSSNPEYPWQDAAGEWQAPCSHPEGGILSPMDAVKLNQLLLLIRRLIN